MHDGVHLRPWRVFERHGQKYCINIQRLQGRKVNAETFMLLHNLASNPHTHLAEEQEMQLLDLELVRTPEDDISSVPIATRPALRTSPVQRLSLLVCQRCNSRCIYCFGGKGEYGAPGAMSEETARAGIDWLLKKSGRETHLAVNYFGGEPALAFDTVRMATEYAIQQGERQGKDFRFSMTTNGTPLGKDGLDFLVQRNFGIIVSLDGPPDIHNRNRPLKSGGDSWAMVTPWTRALIDSGLEITLRATVWRAGELRAAASHLASYGSQRYSTILVQPALHTPDVHPDDPPDHDDLITLLWESAQEFVTACRRGNIDTLKELLRWEQFRLTTLSLGHERARVCSMGRDQFAAGADGSLYPCQSFVGREEFCLGSVHDPETLRNEEYLKKTPSTLECAECWARIACTRGCHYENLMFTQDRFTPPPHFCRYVKQNLEIAMYLDAELSLEDRRRLSEAKLAPRRPCVFVS